MADPAHRSLHSHSRSQVQAQAHASASAPSTRSGTSLEALALVASASYDAICKANGTPQVNYTSGFPEKFVVPPGCDIQKDAQLDVAFRSEPEQVTYATFANPRVPPEPMPFTPRNTMPRFPAFEGFGPTSMLPPASILTPMSHFPTRFLPPPQVVTPPHGQNPKFNPHMRAPYFSGVKADWGVPLPGRGWATVDPDVGQWVKVRELDKEKREWGEWMRGMVIAKTPVHALLGIRFIIYSVQLGNGKVISASSYWGQLWDEIGREPDITAGDAIKMENNMFLRGYVGFPAQHPITHQQCTEWWPARITAHMANCGEIAAWLPLEAQLRWKFSNPIVATWVLPYSEHTRRKLMESGDIVQVVEVP